VVETGQKLSQKPETYELKTSEHQQHSKQKKRPPSNRLAQAILDPSQIATENEAHAAEEQAEGTEDLQRSARIAEKKFDR
jgi:hypothetical protein